MSNNESPKIVATLDARGAGTITWFRLSGHVDYQRLKDAWVAAKRSPNALPEPPTPRAALRRALSRQEGPDTFISAMTDGRLALTVRDRSGDKPTFTTTLVVDLDSTNDRPKLVDGDTSIFAHVAEEFDWFLENLTTQDISTWLVDLVRQLDALTLRDTGGIYFVPQKWVWLWSTIADVLASVSTCKVWEIPAMKADRAVAAILAMLQHEVSNTCEKMDAELGKELGARALRTREKELQSTFEKVQTYEKLLGVSIVDLRQAIDDLNARITAAILLSEGGAA